MTSVSLPCSDESSELVKVDPVGVCCCPRVTLTLSTDNLGLLSGIIGDFLDVKIDSRISAGINGS